MSHLPPLLVLLILAGIVSVVIGRRLQARKLAEQSSESLAESAETPAKAAWFARWFQRPTPSVTAQQFHTWSKQAFAEQALLQSWLESLSEPACDILIVELERFCWNFNFDLRWLMEQPLTNNTRLIKTLNHIVLHFLQACYLSITTSDQLAATKAYQAFVQNPYDKANYAFLQGLFAQLVEEKLTPHISPELFMAPESDRQLYIVQVIRQTAEKDPERFDQVLSKALRTQKEKIDASHQSQPTNKRSIFSVRSSEPTKSGHTKTNVSENGSAPTVVSAH